MPFPMIPTGLGPMPTPQSDRTGGAGNGLGGLLEGFNTFMEAKQGKKDRTAADAEKKRAIAMQKMPLLERAAQANPSDQATIKALQDARKDAGLPPATFDKAQNAALSVGSASPPITAPQVSVGDEGTGVGKTPQTSATTEFTGAPQRPGQMQPNAPQSLDLAQFRTLKNDISENELTQFLSFDEKAKRVVAQRYAPGVITEEMIKLQPQLVPGSAGERAIQHEYDAQYDRATKGEMTSDQFMSWLGQRGETLKLAHIDPEYLKKDPAVLSGLGTAVKAKIAEMEARGIHFKEADKIALQRADNVGDLDKARIKLMGIQGKSLDATTRGRLQHWKHSDEIAQQRATTYQTRVSNLQQQADNGDKAAINNLKGLAGLMSGEARTTQSQIDNLMGTRQHAIDNGADINDPTIQTLSTDIETLKERQKTLQGQSDQINRQYAGKIGMQAAMLTSGLPLGNKIKNVSFGGFSKAAATRTANGGALLLMPDGKLYNKDGSLSASQPTQ